MTAPADSARYEALKADREASEERDRMRQTIQALQAELRLYKILVARLRLGLGWPGEG